MEPARSIARLGFKKWYERRLMEAHAWLLTALLCAIYVEVALEGLTQKGNVLTWLGTAGGMFVGGLIVWHGLRRFFALLVEAERFASQSTCAACKAYARFEVLSEQPKMIVRCRKCCEEWTMS
jgi:hypothetical protein